MMLPCYIDEAQILLTQFKGLFTSHNSNEQNKISRALFSVTARAFNTYVQGPVFAGTGMKMHEAMEALASGAMGKPGSKSRVYSDLPPLVGDSCVQYLSRYIDLNMAAPHDQNAW